MNFKIGQEVYRFVELNGVKFIQAFKIVEFIGTIDNLYKVLYRTMQGNYVPFESYIEGSELKAK